MINLYDILYASTLGASAPFWMTRARMRAKIMEALRDRMGHVPRRDGDEPAVMIHAVSVGEINATVSLVDELGRLRPDLRFIISVTTDTGHERGLHLYGTRPRVTVIRYPLDFSPAVARVLDRLRPVVVVLMELEVWPNFVELCARRHIPVVVLNGRLTESSLQNYRRGGWLVRRIFGRLTAVCAQDEKYGAGFLSLGVQRERMHITGTMKFDTAPEGPTVAGAAELACDVGLEPGQPVWVAGSTGPGEERIVLAAYRDVCPRHPGLRLAIVPRHPQRFDEVAALIEHEGFACVRRSRPEPVRAGVILGDTMGELRKFYALADAVFVGRTLVDLGPRQHGSDMIEPAALGKPTIVGPWTTNFTDPMRHFRDGQAVIEVTDGAGLAREVDRILRVPGELGARAMDVVRRQRGATARNAAIVMDLISRARSIRSSIS